MPAATTVGSPAAPTATTTVAPPPAAAPSADIAVSTLAPGSGPVFAGGAVTYTSVVTNTGPDAATGVFLEVAPVGARVVSVQASSGTCTQTAELACVLGTLADGASAVVSATYTAAAGSTALVVDARAGADQIDPQTGNNLSRLQATCCRVMPARRS